MTQESQAESTGGEHAEFEWPISDTGGLGSCQVCLC